MSHWLNSPQSIKVALDGQTHDATIEWNMTDDYRWAVTIASDEFHAVHEVADDAFEALCLARESLEPDGWLVGVAGAQVDVWPSGMARDQGGGKVAYRAGSPDLVEVFEPVDPATVTTVARQQAAAETHYGGRMR